MKKILLCVLSAIILVAAAVFTIRISRYVIVDFQLYPRDAAVLDLRGQEIAPSHYHALSKKLPDTRIQWDIPFQGGILADDTQTIAVTSLSPEEAQLLAERICAVAKPKELLVCAHEPITGSHVGPGMLAVFFFGKGR